MLLRTSIAIVVSAAVATALVASVSGAWSSALMGGAMAFVGACVGLLLCHLAVSRTDGSIRRQTNRVLGAFVAGMLTRVVLLASSLAVLLLVLGGEPLAFVVAFFLVHLFSQILEIRYMHRNRHAPASLSAKAPMAHHSTKSPRIFSVAVLALAFAASAPALAAPDEHEPGAQPTFTEGLWGFLLDAPYLPIPWPNETWTNKIKLEKIFGRLEFEVAGVSVDMTPTKHTIFLWMAAFLCLVLFIPARRKYDKQGVPSSKGANFVEALVLFIRDEMAVANIGKKEGPRYVPFLLTIFFLILFMNLLALIPYGAAATSNLAVTGALALATFAMTQVAGMRSHGTVGYWTGLVPSGVPWFLYPIMIPIEIMGLFTKPFALTVRLFANMTAGKVVIFALIGLIFLFETALVSPISVAFTLFILVLKLFVSFLQAYIFTMLSSLFIGMASHSH